MINCSNCGEYFDELISSTIPICKKCRLEGEVKRLQSEVARVKAAHSDLAVILRRKQDECNLLQANLRDWELQDIDD